MADQPNEQSIFPTDQTPESVAPNQLGEKPAEASSSNPYDDMLGKITKEDGQPKYATVSDAINSIAPAQQHISTLESELAAMREKMASMAMETQVPAKESHLDNNPTYHEGALGEDQVVGLVDRVLGQREQQQLSQNNAAQVIASLTEKFGTPQAADQAYRQKAVEMGISLDMMNSLAQHSPKAVTAYFGTTGASAPNKTSGSINTASMSQAQPDVKKGNPLLTGSMKDMQSEWTRIKNSLNS